MFTYYFIDKYGVPTTTDFAYDKDMDYLNSRVASGEYQAIIIVKRFFQVKISLDKPEVI